MMRKFVQFSAFAALADWTFAAPSSILTHLDQDHDAVIQERNTRDATTEKDACVHTVTHTGCDADDKECNEYGLAEIKRNTKSAISIAAQLACLKQEHDKMYGDDGLPGDANRSLQRGDMGLVNLYGCWCYFQDDVGHGSGTAVDDLDAMCQTLHKGYECILMEFGEETCTPWDIVYNSAFSSGSMPFGLNMVNLVSECDVQNPSDGCAAATCKVEGYFVLSYFTYSVFGGTIDNTKRHSNGFDPVDTCGARALNPVVQSPIFEESEAEQNGGNGGGESSEEGEESGGAVLTQKACCGEYPVRFPYGKTTKNHCCQATALPTLSLTYNPQLLVCCADDGTTADSEGNCP